MERRSIILLAGSLMLALVVAVADLLTPEHNPAMHREFQQALGGLGLGPSLGPWPCPTQFDPRAGTEWQSEAGLLPCGHWSCPGHHSSILPLSALGSKREGRSGKL